MKPSCYSSSLDGDTFRREDEPADSSRLAPGTRKAKINYLDDLHLIGLEDLPRYYVAAIGNSGRDIVASRWRPRFRIER